MIRAPGPPRRRLPALLAALALLRPPTLLAAPPPATPPGSEPLAAFEAGFTAGQARFDAGDYLDAARVWIAAADNLEETTIHRHLRLAVYEYVADAYRRALDDDAELATTRAALATLDAYCERFTRAYGTETPLSERITAVRDDLRRRVAAREAADARARASAASRPAPAPRSRAATRPWKGLVIGGGVLLGLGLGAVALAGVGAARGQRLERAFDDPDNMCDLHDPQGDCADLYSDGKTSNALAIAGAVLTPLLLGGGAALLAIGLKRRAARHALAPALAPGFVGLQLRARF